MANAHELERVIPVAIRLIGFTHLFVMLKTLAESDGHVDRDEADFFAEY